MTPSRGQRVVVVAPGELASGFRLAGVGTREVADAEAAAAALAELTCDGETGVVAVHEPFLAALDPARRARLAGLVRPVVVALPAGLADAGGASGARAQLVELLQRAVGYRMRFGREEQTT